MSHSPSSGGLKETGTLPRTEKCTRAASVGDHFSLLGPDDCTDTLLLQRNHPGVHGYFSVPAFFSSSLYARTLSSFFYGPAALEWGGHDLLTSHEYSTQVVELSAYNKHWLCGCVWHGQTLFLAEAVWTESAFRTKNSNHEHEYPAGPRQIGPGVNLLLPSGPSHHTHRPPHAVHMYKAPIQQPCELVLPYHRLTVPVVRPALHTTHHHPTTQVSIRRDNPQSS